MNLSISMKVSNKRSRRFYPHQSEAHPLHCKDQPNKPKTSPLSITVLSFLSSIIFSLSLQSVVVAEEVAAKEVAAVHGLAMHGTPKYGADFTHFEFVNPNAPKGGTLTRETIGDNFDTFNPFLVKGVPAAGVGLMFDTLTKHSGDEAFTEYGLIAEKIQMPEDRSWVIFHINPKAKFSDGQPITAEDVKFTFEMLTTSDKVQPFYKTYYGDVTEVQILDPLRIKFQFKNDQNKELPLILGQLNILPKHFWATRNFEKADLTVPVGSGPYLLESYEAGRRVVWKRNPDYWAKNLPVNKGFYNFDEIIYEYYKDRTVALEAFKAGEFDFTVENTARNWANAYVGPKFDSGELVKEEIHHKRPAGMQAFVFNTRRTKFDNPQVRRALAYAFDFEWTNQNLFYSQYKRTNSYFENSELASRGLPSAAELEILQPYKSQLPEEVFTKAYQAPTTAAPSNLRKNLREGLKILKAAGWNIVNGTLVNGKTGQPLKFEIMLYSKDFERIVQPFIQNLKKMGVQASIRLVDTTQYINRIREFDFDMLVYTIPQSNSPGNEQRDFWYSGNADVQGSRNIPGVKDPVVDALIEKVISATDREDLIAHTRALDRVLLWNHYVIPNWHNPSARVAYKANLMRPAITPDSGADLMTWWFKP
ncbi:extracellular solute-binding protein [Oleiphilus messinensis]|uniref:extracellular solute-binding protein n=1 Tax=Oleiphilus messinensis TaxID=141451 RepID=UPI001E5B5649|nr:extracellular solute-binding protein [Oleiphilus messinensis]